MRKDVHVDAIFVAVVVAEIQKLVVVVQRDETRGALGGFILQELNMAVNLTRDL
jgi:hypothetical protein